MNISPSGIATLLLVFVFASFLVARRYVVGPWIWLKGAMQRKQAEEGTDRQELIERVRKILPLANENNVVFSLHHESTTRGNSKVSVVTHTYYARVFVADGDDLWVIPMDYDRRKRSYTLGEPARITCDLVRKIRLTGRRGKNLVVTFSLEADGQEMEIAMDLAPYCFRKNSFYPFALVQQSACDAAMETVEKMARMACDLTPGELEEGRLKDECSNYGVYAGVAAVIGVLAVPAESIVPAVICFLVALAFLGLIVAKRQIPKVSAAVVLVAAVIAVMMAR